MAKEFLENYEKYKDKIYNYLLFRLDFNRAIAEDLTQEVFLKAFENYDTYDSDRPFQAWIYAIAKNHLKNYYRIQGREVDSKEYSDKLMFDMLSEVHAKLEWENVVCKIRALPDKYAEVLLLRFIDGLDNNEIAETLGIEEGAVRTRISRALKTINEKSNKQEYEIY